MEVKVNCSCGTRYAFEVEPVHGRMPAPVNCPSCGADGTAQANENIRLALAPAPAQPAAPLRVAVPTPPPALRINRPATPPSAASAPAEQTAQAPPPVIPGPARRPVSAAA